MSKRKRAKSKSSFKNLKKRATHLFLYVGIISTISIVGYGAWTARHILEPISTFASDNPEISVSKSKDQIKFYTLTLNKDDYVINASLTLIDTHENSLHTITLPTNTQLHLPYGLSEFKLASLYKITSLEKSKDIRNLVTQTLVEYFGVPSSTLYIIREYDTPHESFTKWITDPQTIMRLTFDTDWTRKSLITSQSSWDVLKLANTVRQIPTEFSTEVNIAQSGIGSEEKMKDETSIIVTDQNKLDSYIKNSFQNIALIQEKANIRILNSTDTSGLGGKFARVVTNMGGVVIDVGNNEEKLNETTLLIKDAKWETSATVQELKNSLTDTKVIVKPSTDTADIVIILGNSYAQTIQGSSSRPN